VPRIGTGKPIPVTETPIKLLRMTTDAARLEGRSSAYIHSLLVLRQRAVQLYVRSRDEEAEDGGIRDEILALEPQANQVLHPREAEPAGSPAYAVGRESGATDPGNS